VGPIAQLGFKATRFGQNKIRTIDLPNRRHRQLRLKPSAFEGQPLSLSKMNKQLIYKNANGLGQWTWINSIERDSM